MFICKVLDLLFYFYIIDGRYLPKIFVGKARTLGYFVKGAKFDKEMASQVLEEVGEHQKICLIEISRKFRMAVIKRPRAILNYFALIY